jgi:hypothetical protein
MMEIHYRAQKKQNLAVLAGMRVEIRPWISLCEKLTIHELKELATE